MTPDADPRPLWILAPGGRPTLASSKRAPEGAMWWAREGDAKWTPVDAAKPEPPKPPPTPNTRRGRP